MGIIRGGLLVVASVLLFTCFLVGGSLLVVSNSLEYENIQKELVPVVTEVIEEQIDISSVIDEKFPIMQEYCQNNSEYVFDAEGQTFDVSCDSIEQGTDTIIQEVIEETVEEFYYTNYDCTFLNCFKENKEMPYFLVSEQTQNYFEGKFYFVLILSLIFVGIMFFLVETKTNLPILVGSLLVVSSLPFMKLDSIVGNFADKSLLQFFTFLFTQSYSVFIISLILGILLIALGIFLKFFGWGFKISELINKFRGKSGSNQKEKTSQKPKKIDVKNTYQKNSKLNIKTKNSK